MITACREIFSERLPASVVQSLDLPRTWWRLRAAVRLITRVEGIRAFACDDTRLTVTTSPGCAIDLAEQWGRVLAEFAPVERGVAHIAWTGVSAEDPYL